MPQPPPGAADRAAAALRAFADPGGRSVMVDLAMGDHRWSDGVGEHVPRPAASLLKTALGIAVERAFDAGRLDPGESVPVGAVGDLAGSVLALLEPAVTVTSADLLSLTLGASDNTAARWLAQRVPPADVLAVLADLGCRDTTVRLDASAPDLLQGQTTCADALALLTACADPGRHPRCATALRRSIRNSRIPLGAREEDIVVAHKTGTLPGLAHDVAILECAAGTVQIAFLTDRQHDTLVTGYAMGMCTRDVLEAWGLAVRRTVSVDGE